MAVQILFLWDFNGKTESDLEALRLEVFRNFAPNFDDQGFVSATLKGLYERQAEIDHYISRYATEWPLEQITIVDRNVLRVGVYELVYSNDIPAKVAINEAIEIAKAFGSDSSGRFVNGVLGAIYRDVVASGQLARSEEKSPAPQAA